MRALFLALAITTLALGAQAGVFTTRTSDAGLAPTYERFDGPGCTIETSVALLGTRGLDYDISNDSLANRRRQPGADCYLSVGSAAVISTNLVIDFPDGAPIRFVSFRWGSPDEYNSVSFLSETGQEANISGYGLATSGSDATTRANLAPYTTLFAEFRFFAGEQITAMVLSSLNWAFEIDDLGFSTAFVPNSIVVDGGGLIAPAAPAPFALPAPAAGALALLAVPMLRRRRPGAAR